MRIARLFFNSAAVVLLLAATAKFISSAGHAKILLQRDPLTGFQFQNLFRMVGGMEVAVAVFCFSAKRAWIPAGLIAWLATIFLSYRLGLALLDYRHPCNCLGNLTDALHVSPQIADLAMKIILAYLLIGSYATLIWLWRRGRKVPKCLTS